MHGMHVKALLRYMLIMTGICLSLFLLVELTGWLLVPDRYRNPPAVTADAWIHSDALTGTDTLWLKEFVDEFCRSYSARWTSYLYFRREPFSGRLINVDSSGRENHSSIPAVAGRRTAYPYGGASGRFDHVGHLLPRQRHDTGGSRPSDCIESSEAIGARGEHGRIGLCEHAVTHFSGAGTAQRECSGDRHIV